MTRYRWEYGLFCLFTAVLLLFSSQSFFLGLLILELIFPIFLFLLLRFEARRLSVDWKSPKTGVEGQEIRLRFRLRSPRLFTAGNVVLRFQLENAVFHQTEQQEIYIPMHSREREFEVPILMESCGLRRFSCIELELRDLFGLCHVRLKTIPELFSVIYPQNAAITLLSENRMEKNMELGRIAQNKKGNDATEIYDLREYTAGDDIRSIHWKLSAKLGKWILRESSASMQIRTLMLLDIGMERHGQHCPEELLRAGIALASGLSESFSEQGFQHCVGWGLENRLQLMMVSEKESYRNALENWLSVPLPAEAGRGLKLFQMEKEDHSFTRLFYISVDPELGLESFLPFRDMEVLAISVREDGEELQYLEKENVSLIQVPLPRLKRERAESLRITV